MRRYSSRYRRRPAAGTSGHTMFGSTGWLFADLLLALALAFLLATTFGVIPPPVTNGGKPTHPPTSAATTAKPTTSPTPTPTEPDALDLNYVKVPLDIDPGNISASSIQHTIETDPALKGRQAGLVLLFAGGPDPNGGQWEAIDSQVWSILQGMDKDISLFRVAVPRPFWNGTYPLTEVMLNVYLFKPKP
jgi:hypothetical protein